VNGATGTWVRSHTESRFGRLYIADFPSGPSVLVEFGPVRATDANERLKYAGAVAPAIARAVAKEQA